MMVHGDGWYQGGGGVDGQQLWTAVVMMVHGDGWYQDGDGGDRQQLWTAVVMMVHSDGWYQGCGGGGCDLLLQVQKHDGRKREEEKKTGKNTWSPFLEPLLRKKRKSKHTKSKKNIEKIMPPCQRNICANWDTLLPFDFLHCYCVLTYLGCCLVTEAVQKI